MYNKRKLTEEDVVFDTWLEAFCEEHFGHSKPELIEEDHELLEDMYDRGYTIGQASMEYMGMAD